MSDKSQTSINTDSKLDRIEKLVIGVVNGQSAMKSELLTRIKGVHNEVTKVHSELVDFKKETAKNFEKVNKEIKENRIRIEQKTAFA